MTYETDKSMQETKKNYMKLIDLFRMQKRTIFVLIAKHPCLQTGYKTKTVLCSKL
jgi:hypothetical protein